MKSKIGDYPLCNGKPETAPHIMGFCFPICWRCFTMIISVIITTILLDFYNTKPVINIFSSTFPTS